MEKAKDGSVFSQLAGAANRVQTPAHFLSGTVKNTLAPAHSHTPEYTVWGGSVDIPTFPFDHLVGGFQNYFIDGTPLGPEVSAAGRGLSGHQTVLRNNILKNRV